MADISIIHEGSTDYKVKDAAGRLALAEVENKGAKNLAPNTAKSKTASTVSFTVKSDGTVLANGTASTAAWFMTAENLTLQPGTYVISGGQKADGTVNVRVVFSTSETAADIIADSNGESTEFTITSATTANVYVQMGTGRTANNVTVYPMICTKAEWAVSKKFVPYAPTNRELYETKSTVDDICGKGNSIYGTYASLNDIMTPGRYYVATGAQAVTITNSPYTAAGYGLYVIANSSDVRLSQLLLPNPVQGDTSTYGFIYKRDYIYNAWGSWYKFEGTEVT